MGHSPLLFTCVPLRWCAFSLTHAHLCAGRMCCGRWHHQIQKPSVCECRSRKVFHKNCTYSIHICCHRALPHTNKMHNTRPLRACCVCVVFVAAGGGIFSVILLFHYIFILCAINWMRCIPTDETHTPNHFHTRENARAKAKCRRSSRYIQYHHNENMNGIVSSFSVDTLHSAHLHNDAMREMWRWCAARGLHSYHLHFKSLTH